MFTEWNVEHLALAVELFEDYEVMRPFLSEREEKTFLQVRSALMGEFDRRDGVAERVAEEAFPLTIRKKLDLRAGTGTHRSSPRTSSRVGSSEVRVASCVRLPSMVFPWHAALRHPGPGAQSDLHTAHAAGIRPLTHTSRAVSSYRP